MSKTLQKFISYFTISSLVYYFFLIVETTSLYYNEFGLDLGNTFMVSFSSIESVINFGVFISIILTSSDLLKENFPISKIIKSGIAISLLIGGIIFFLLNNVVPEIKMESYLNRYENARKEAFSSEERVKKINDLRSRDANIMSIGLIKKFTDSLKNQNTSQKKIISELFQKIPDSIINNDFSNKELNKYGVSKNKLTSDFNRRDLIKLKTEIRKNEVLEKQLRTSNWKKSERYLNMFLTIFLTCFGLVIGVNFKNQKIFSLVCVGIVIYSQTLTLLSTMSDYFINEKNLIGLIFKLILILVVFLYLIYRMQTYKNTGANKA
ncbi:hypothetical protein [Thalassobellus citreus]|uniref:hypothetical protein n=1 Tax=Thalassobellus citreus TaxID=3367752 RepID=UPI00378BB65F